MRALTTRTVGKLDLSQEIKSAYGHVEISNDAPKFARSLAAALRDVSQTVAIVDAFSEACHIAIITTPLAKSASALDTHWKCFAHLQSAGRLGIKQMVIVQDTGGVFSGGPSGGWNGGGLGLARTARREWPDATARLFDVAVSSLGAKASAAVSVQLMAHSEPDIGVDDDLALRVPAIGDRLIVARESGKPQEGHWLVSGGGRGVTADCVIELARRTGGTFTLLGRSQLVDWPAQLPENSTLVDIRSSLIKSAKQSGTEISLPQIDRSARALIASRDIRATLSAVQSHGGVAQYKVCDISKPQDLGDLLSHQEKTIGPITGLVHGAGVLADRAIADKTQQDFKTVFAPKIGGLQALLSVLNISQLTHIALFSSAAARFGNVGQADYAMANEILNRVANHLSTQHPAMIVRSFNWGPWDGGMVDETLARHFESQDIGLIPRGVGARIFADQMLNPNETGVELLVGDEWTN